MLRAASAKQNTVYTLGSVSRGDDWNKRKISFAIAIPGRLRQLGYAMAYKEQMYNATGTSISEGDPLLGKATGLRS